MAGNSGPLLYEINWETITLEGKHRQPIEEKTSVTKNVRRVARFDPDIVRSAISVNKPSRIVLNHLDYIDFPISNDFRITKKHLSFINKVQCSIQTAIDYVGLGPGAIINRKSYLRIAAIN